jgi:hypothetical protein
MRYASLRNSSAVSVVRGRVARESDLFSLWRRSVKVGVRSVIVSAVESCFGVESRTVLMLTSMGGELEYVNAELEGWRRSRDLDHALHTGFRYVPQILMPRCSDHYG